MYFLLKTGIFHCYVSLPEGTSLAGCCTWPTFKTISACLAKNQKISEEFWHSLNFRYEDYNMFQSHGQYMDRLYSLNSKFQTCHKTDKVWADVCSSWCFFFFVYYWTGNPANQFIVRYFIPLYLTSHCFFNTPHIKLGVGFKYCFFWPWSLR